MRFYLLQPRQPIPRDDRTPAAYLRIDHWNDYSFVTMFYLTVRTTDEQEIPVGNIKIGFFGQESITPTYSTLDDVFEQLPTTYFSLGMDVDYYINVASLPNPVQQDLLRSLNDMVFEPSILISATAEPVFRTSLLRDVSQSVIKGQYSRVLNGMAPLTDFRFSYYHPPDGKTAELDLEFKVVAESRPSTNIHAIIGRNGAGKTTLLNSMVQSIADSSSSNGYFYERNVWSTTGIDPYYFSCLISISFSAFDSFIPPSEKADPSDGPRFFYVGLKRATDQSSELKTLPELHEEFVDSLVTSLSQDAKKERWCNAVTSLESDDNFADMGLLTLAELSKPDLKDQALSVMARMSAGHAIVLLTITKLVEKVEEKTLVIVDEPESHLHAPLLSAFVRALSNLLHDRNGVAIAATHSPVVLQEIPRSCVWKIRRTRLHIDCQRPEQETFGENVGTLTREVFGLEVEKSGFHTLLRRSVERGLSFDQVLSEYDGQLGYEGQAILRALIAHRDDGAT